MSLEEAALPDDPALDAAARALACPPDALRFGPSDDYELLLAIGLRCGHSGSAIWSSSRPAMIDSMRSVASSVSPPATPP